MGFAVLDAFTFGNVDAASGAFDHPFRPACGGHPPPPGSAILRTAKNPENKQNQSDQEQIFHVWVGIE
ncbi:hypothetical protein FACS1894158_16010 [Betaproteobacteria bacterium]|nr:hypothetical protein FACS1894158_16010 [Betaproteobacteria bacterium]